ncbi:DNA-deoxyinosine glycosylase [Campylobacter pinnipediorum]|uniref:DNA-deoxyinosine glycosylase n=1 Tax=Campylobacter pinnipediorum TaxID=1965231 RepID=UPI0009C28649|nr:DNA-deoxyinosine glycosylase [Campylobacter pinnipediorum]AQW82594.1 G:T/U mismatch-specific DNA glycosylase [Campylobacter pinnipediorum subsp. pinnipediorum]
MQYGLDPIFDENSKVLILGSFPSEISRKAGFYYVNKRNRFWNVLAKVFNTEIPETNEGKVKFLLEHNIAIYDAICSCDIKGSLDKNIKNAVPSDLSPIFNKAKIEQVFANGTKAYDDCETYLKAQILKATNKDIIKLPSTSPANTRFNLETLAKSWEVIRADI